jgi:hypothetical protein
MYTVEMDFDDIEITILDDYANHEDLKINAFDDVVFIRQWNEEANRFDVISLSPSMWEEFLVSIHSPDGVFISGKKF